MREGNPAVKRILGEKAETETDVKPILSSFHFTPNLEKEPGNKPEREMCLRTTKTA